MTSTDELKILDDKLKANQAQHDLDSDAAKVSALLSKELDKYQYLTGEELGYKPSVVERVKFEYSPFDETLNEVSSNEQVCLVTLLFEKYFSHHRAT